MQLHRIQSEGHGCGQKQHDRHLEYGEDSDAAHRAPELRILNQSGVVLEADELGAADHLLLEEGDVNGVHNWDDEHEDEHHGERPHELPAAPVGLVLVDAGLGRVQIRLLRQDSHRWLRGCGHCLIGHNRLLSWNTDCCAAPATRGSPDWSGHVRRGHGKAGTLGSIPALGDRAARRKESGLAAGFDCWSVPDVPAINRLRHLTVTL